ncbi:NADH-FMN oxidoreductase RutF, flavin reductase (DIM6/NTAB) family [Nonomuraea solani]|uniref:NADH-FMN oxidoreductase RutF, flavin reductase (DIM6/NTAB) family n=1 Tax=Nonomuraea solani TaxID=1144553 RepID=A0A1H6CRU1_9ACTN|nr:flavin reductase family protein [Nonomuraea solani]SEG75363.1 NADH-FMN oxidoreductase RutF, flavin reductase (DIM6/NTAB) family [Nonomuraea solani]
MMDSTQLRRAFASFPSGVTAVCTLVDAVPVGMVCSTFTGVSLDPALVSVCVQASSTTWPLLRRQSRLGLSVLAEDQDLACRQLSRKSGDRFEGLRWENDARGGVFLPGAVAWFSCSLYEEMPAGDHAIALLEIHDLRSVASGAPLVFHGSRFRRLEAIA